MTMEFKLDPLHHIRSFFRRSHRSEQSVLPEARERYHLKFTGTADEVEFRARCSENDYWYHSFYFTNGLVQRGDYDIGLDVDDYSFPDDMSGMSVLDIGTGSGWFAAYFEQRGADVVTVDARGYCDFDVFGRDTYPHVSTQKSAPDRIGLGGTPLYYSPASKGFWIMKELLGLRASYLNARVYEISPDLFMGRKFDLVFMGSILGHLRDPIGALMAAHSVCKHQLIATVHMLPTVDPKPTMALREGAADGITWWLPNRACVYQWLRAAGFKSMKLDGTVNFSVDSPYRDEQGRSLAVNQTQELIHAFV
jgi:tRNA (mo5U34)-methyltransferase